MKIINPATEELIKEIADDTPKTLEEKFKKLKDGQTSWGHKTIEDRVATLSRFVTLLGSNKEELALDLTHEMGKPIQESRNEIDGAIYRIHFFIEHAHKWLNPVVVHETDTVKEVLAYEPLGVICNISAWNYPYLVGVNVFVPALISGNAVCYKPSEYATLTGINISELLYEAGVPKDVFQSAVGAGPVGKSLLKLPFDGYFFTGSYPTGKSIAEAVAGKLVPVGLELGGKDPIYVMDDVEDVQATATSLVEGCFYNNGQSCCAVERLYIHEKIYDAFVDAFVDEVKKLKVGDPTEEGSSIGPLARPQQSKFLATQLKDAIDKGATVLVGGKETTGPNDKGVFFEPTVLVNVDHSMSVMKDETFGPIIGIQKVKNDEEALALMKDTPFGLTAGVFSKDESRARDILGHIDSGNTYWNCSDRVSPYLPWAGRKQSGLGSTLSYLGILAFVKPKGYHLKSLGS